MTPARPDALKNGNAGGRQPHHPPQTSEMPVSIVPNEYGGLQAKALSFIGLIPQTSSSSSSTPSSRIASA